MESAIEAGPAVRNNGTFLPVCSVKRAVFVRCNLLFFQLFIGGGHYNHAFFWDEMAPPDKAKATKPSAELEGLINKSFGSMDEMKAAFEARAAPGALFGSGWVWVCVNKKGDELKLVGTPNQVGNQGYSTSHRHHQNLTLHIRITGQPFDEGCLGRSYVPHPRT